MERRKILREVERPRYAVRRLTPAAPPAVEIGPALEAKAASDGAYREFVGAVVDACRSAQAARLGITRYAMEEKRDLESPDWITITLTVWFSSPDQKTRMKAWADMRGIVDARTAPLREGAGGDEISEIDERFFISMGR